MSITEIIQTIGKDFYADLFQPTTKELGYSLGRIAHALQIATIIPGALGDASIVLEERLKDFLINSLKKTPDNKRIIPEPTVTYPIIENVANSFNQEELVKLYSNLLSAATNKDTVNKAHPAFATIISQMSSLDAKIFNNLNSPFFLVTCITQQTNATGLLQNLYLNDDYPEVNTDVAISLSNLERLGLIYITNNLGIVKINSEYKPLIKRFKETKYYKEQVNLYGEKAVEVITQPCNITELGFNFREICSPKVKN